MTVIHSNPDLKLNAASVPKPADVIINADKIQLQFSSNVVEADLVLHVVDNALDGVEAISWLHLSSPRNEDDPRWPFAPNSLYLLIGSMNLPSNNSNDNDFKA